MIDQRSDLFWFDPAWFIFTSPYINTRIIITFPSMDHPVYNCIHGSVASRLFSSQKIQRKKLRRKTDWEWNARTRKTRRKQRSCILSIIVVPCYHISWLLSIFSDHAATDDLCIIGSVSSLYDLMPSGWCIVSVYYLAFFAWCLIWMSLIQTWLKEKDEERMRWWITLMLFIWSVCWRWVFQDQGALFVSGRKTLWVFLL